MRSVRLRLALLVGAAVLFAAWIGWLAYLVTRRPPVVAHTEILLADSVVVAHLNSLQGPVTVRAVCKPADAAEQEKEGLKEGAEVHVTNLEHCRADWTGPGDYIVPLLRTDEAYEVANPTGYPEARVRGGGDVPSRSPGYYVPRGEVPAPHIYPANADTEAQVAEVLGRRCGR